MPFSNVSIIGLAHVDAPHRIPSTEIEQRLAKTAERLGVRPDLLSTLTGIQARRFWDEGVMPSDAATMAAERALEASGLDRARIGMLVNTSVCRDYIEPSTACIVHGNLGLSEACRNFDLGNACLAFLDGIDVVGNMIERGQLDYGLVVDGEGSRFVVEKTLQRLEDPNCDVKTFRDNFATLTLGSGGVAMVLGRADRHPEGHRVVGSVSVAATEHRKLCHGQVDGMVTNASALLLAGLDVAQRTFARASDVLRWKPEALDELVIHQVSAVHTMKLVELLGLDMQKVLAIYPEFGNMGPASIPTVLSKSAEAGRLKPGTRVALMGIGSGLNCSMMEIAW